MDAKVRITVLRRTLNEDFLKEYTDEMWKPCSVFRDGQEFVATPAVMPEDFCGWAWADIQGIVMTLARGGNFIGVSPGIFITCCTDGFRPVAFKLERIEPSQV
jgi:uncharacterized repeat protein (TIGR04076 family)